MKLMKVFYRLSFRIRLWLVCVSMIVVVALFVGIVSYNIAANALEKELYKMKQEAVKKTAQAIDEKLSHIRMSVLSMTISLNYRRAVGLEESRDIDSYYSHLSIMQDTITQLKLTEPLIDTILIETARGTFYLMPHKRTSVTFKNSEFYEMLVNQTGMHREVWVSQHTDLFFHSSKEVISFITDGALNDKSKQIYIVTNILAKKLEELVIGELDGNELNYLLLTQDGQMFLNSNIDLFKDESNLAQLQAVLHHPNGHLKMNIENDNYLVNYERLEGMNNISLFAFQSESQVLKELNTIKHLIISSILVCIVISSLLIDILTKKLLRPMNALRKLMKDVGRSQLDVRYQSEYQDEISQLGHQFNNMLDEIQSLFNEVKIVEREKEQIEVRVLQAQIKPHFLYNTLNSVYWKSQMNQTAEVQEMLLSLSKLFQIGLNRGQELISLRLELSHVEQYLKIQQLCYKNLFQYTINIEPNVDQEIKVLKVFLQPLVENSIVHGFKDRNEGGIIHISAREENDRLLCIIEDNGLGIPADQLIKINNIDQYHQDNITANHELSGKYALYNIHRRLSLYYGKTAVLSVDSIPNQYTRIIIKLPLNIVEMNNF